MTWREWVYQINEKHDQPGWVGAFVQVTEVEAWGVYGFIVNIVNRDEQQRITARLEWREIDYVGQSSLAARRNAAEW